MLMFAHVHTYSMGKRKQGAGRKKRGDWERRSIKVINKEGKCRWNREKCGRDRERRAWVL